MSKDNSFAITPPAATVQIHLPGETTLTGPRGAMVGDFLKIVKKDFSAPIVAAIVNCELHELTFPVEMESQVTPITMDTADGARIYRRSLVCLLEMAFADLFPKGKLTIDHSLSSGGYFCQVAGRGSLSPVELEELNKHMHGLVKEDLPFERREIPLAGGDGLLQENRF